MRGRSIPIEVFPLSFPEYLRFNGVFKKIPRAGFTAREKGVLRRAMSDYMERGGFPDVQDVSDGMRASMLQGYVDAVLYRDIIERIFPCPRTARASPTISTGSRTPILPIPYRFVLIRLR